MAERRIVIFEWMTADGFFARPDGNLDWVVPDEAQSRVAANEIGRFDTVLFGRRTYEQFAACWPRVLEEDDSATVPDPHQPGRRSREHRTVGVALDAMTKLVFSRTLKQTNWKNSHIVRSFDPRAIQAINQQPGKDESGDLMLTRASATLYRSVSRAERTSISSTSPTSTPTDR
jgi:dihydrofolate reductase